MASSEVTVRFKGDTRSLDRALGNVNRSMKRMDRNSKRANRSLQGISKSAGLVSGAIKLAAVAFAGFATGRGISGVINATKTFEGFRAQLTAYLGDQKLANAELARLEQLATGLPQSLTDLTNGFTVLTREGIGTTNEEMKAFANIASANNKTLSQLAEALGDATRGEFERIKEFGVKVNKDGDRFVATFRGQTLAVSDDAHSLVNEIRKIGEEGGTFFGAAESQSDTLTGAMSRLNDAVTKAFRTLGEGGLATAIKTVADDMSSFMDNNKELIKDIGENLSVAVFVAADAFAFLVRNLDKVVIAMGAIIGVMLIKSLFGLASMVIGVVGPAFALLGKTLFGLATFITKSLIRVALGGLGIAFAKIIAVVGLVGAATYGLAKAWDFVFGTELSNGIENFAKEAMEEAEKIVGGIGKMGSEVLSLADDWTGASGMIKTGTNLITDAQLKFNNAMAGYKTRAAEARTEQDKLTESYDDHITRLKKAQLEEERLAQKRAAIQQAIRDDSKKAIDLIDQETNVLKIKQRLLGQNDNVTRDAIALMKEETRFRKANKDETEEQVQAHLKLFAAQQAENRAIEDAIELYEEKNQKLEESLANGKQIFEDLNPLETLESQRTQDLKDLAEYHRKNKSSTAQHQSDIERLNHQHSKALLDIRRDQMRQQMEMAGVTNTAILDAVDQQMINIDMIQKGGIQAAQGTLGAMVTIFGQMSGMSKDAFETYKKLQIAQALISTASGVVSAIGNPMLPFPLNLLVAGTVFAAGMAQVNLIRGQQYTGRQLGGPVTEGESFLVGETGPEIFTPSTSGRIDRMDSLGSSPVEINFTINAVDTQGFDELLVSRRGVIQQVISDAMLESGQRSRF